MDGVMIVFDDLAYPRLLFFREYEGCLLILVDSVEFIGVSTVLFSFGETVMIENGIPGRARTQFYSSICPSIFKKAAGLQAF
jgi:hypothetical protein